MSSTANYSKKGQAPVFDETRRHSEASVMGEEVGSPQGKKEAERTIGEAEARPRASSPARRGEGEEIGEEEKESRC